MGPSEKKARRAETKRGQERGILKKMRKQNSEEDVVPRSLLELEKKKTLQLTTEVHQLREKVKELERVRARYEDNVLSKIGKSSLTFNVSLLSCWRCLSITNKHLKVFHSH